MADFQNGFVGYDDDDVDYENSPGVRLAFRASVRTLKTEYMKHVLVRWTDKCSVPHFIQFPQTDMPASTSRIKARLEKVRTELMPPLPQHLIQAEHQTLGGASGISDSEITGSDATTSARRLATENGRDRDRKAKETLSEMDSEDDDVSMAKEDLPLLQGLKSKKRKLGGSAPAAAVAAPPKKAKKMKGKAA
ncbi:unnamed protein product [Polarella glacialis]|uniref:Uncharacterized protein n=1 Tax=Polarella glacialis TaxID=89957 RepID=A0A813JHQ1_POLGL|nr:unnamed protein product [Polarella glacialis]